MTTAEKVIRKMRKVAESIYHGNTYDDNYAVLEALYDCISVDDLDADTEEFVEAVLGGATIEDEGEEDANLPDNDRNLGLEERLPAGGWRR